MSTQATLLFDAPGPRARLRNHLLTAIGLVALLAIAWFVYTRFDEKGQWRGEIWEPFLRPETWTNFIFPGLLGTLKAAALGAVFALAFGAIFGLARLSEHRWIRIPAGVVVEVFRAIPLLLLIFFVFYWLPSAFGGGDYTLIAVVAGLALYNGSVLAEIVRAGVLSVPKGQSEAAYAIGLRRTGVLWRILLPQAVTAMMPAIVSQLVVLLKDTALGYIIAYVDLLNFGFKIIPPNFPGSLIPAAIVIGIIYIGINMLLSALAHWLERRSRRSRKTSARPLGPSTGIPAAAAAGQPPAVVDGGLGN
ncbi:amino acid ABC transporter permease [Spongiactinospora sp. TRM90649]|uniref:amino acid ABC transporter permease n=1 Tax=Spongiactinospora sp. TRM90649 TaxID=3031114 RepID=UPI0023F84226|nr:amino acid ABC transporter permease [Spongiactinospora sp. TRM90649]MDF5754058.1 amino acid ABC transporter permease [Spongiactinospora sp. TRM90649]